VELGDDSGDALPIKLDRVAEKFVEYYWRQVRPYRGEILHQNAGRQAGILRRLIGAQNRYGSQLSELRSQRTAYESTVRGVAQVVRQMPLWKLQTVAGSTLPFLYDAPEVDRAIVLKPGIAYCFRAFHGFIRRLLRAEWLGYVRGHRANLPIIGETNDLDAFLFETERESLEYVRPMLKDLQRGQCFYCHSQIHGSGDVDHFIPWGRYPVDLGHNFVLAHSNCNGAKSDHLAGLGHLENWVARNDNYRHELEKGFGDRRVAFDEVTSMRVVRWAYATIERTGGQLWVSADLFEPLDPRWHALLQ
jgi:5-methylcytosine-specific restriction endonuclease McrA